MLRLFLWLLLFHQFWHGERVSLALSLFVPHIHTHQEQKGKKSIASGGGGFRIDSGAMFLLQILPILMILIMCVLLLPSPSRAALERTQGRTWRCTLKGRAGPTRYYRVHVWARCQNMKRGTYHNAKDGVEWCPEHHLAIGTGSRAPLQCAKEVLFLPHRSVS